MVLFLHGKGERGDDPELVKAHGLPRLAEEGRCFPFVIIAPQCPKGRSWSVDFLETVLDDAIDRYRIDPNRVVLTGISMGGNGAWNLAIRHPDRFAALIPIAAWGNHRKISRLGRLPVWAFHGGGDRVVPLREGKAMTDALKKAGGRVKFTVYKSADHVQTWEKAYGNDGLYRWMMKQKRQAGKTRPR